MEFEKIDCTGWSEDRICQEFYFWFHNTFPQYRGLLFHVPNGGTRNKREGAKFKMMGVYPGVADYIFFWNGIAYCIEAKERIKGLQSPKQKEWEATVKANGILYYIEWTLDDLKERVLTIMEF